MIKTIKGDAFAALSDEDVILAHGVNCKGAFGSGFAKTMAQRLPHVREAYMQKHQTVGWRLGEVQLIPVGENKWVANCATQKDYGSPKSGKKYISYDAVNVVFDQLVKLADLTQSIIAMPKIGCGLAGGDWKQVKELLKRQFESSGIDVKVYYI